MIFIEEMTDKMALIQAGKFLEKGDMRDFRMLLGDLLDVGKTKIIIDFSNTEHIYYRIADSLAKLEQEMIGRGGKLMLVGMSRYLEDILSVVGYTDHFLRYETRAETGSVELSFVHTESVETGSSESKYINSATLNAW